MLRRPCTPGALEVNRSSRGAGKTSTVRSANQSRCLCARTAGGASHASAAGAVPARTAGAARGAAATCRGGKVHGEWARRREWQHEGTCSPCCCRCRCRCRCCCSLPLPLPLPSMRCMTCFAQSAIALQASRAQQPRRHRLRTSHNDKHSGFSLTAPPLLRRTLEPSMVPMCMRWGPSPRRRRARTWTSTSRSSESACLSWTNGSRRLPRRKR